MREVKSYSTELNEIKVLCILFLTIYTLITPDAHTMWFPLFFFFMIREEFCGCSTIDSNITSHHITSDRITLLLFIYFQNMSSAGGLLLGHEVVAIIRHNPLFEGTVL